MTNRLPFQKQGVVRRAAFERSLQDHNLIIGQKTAQAIREYHSRFIEPRLRWLEAWPWERAFWTLQAWVDAGRTWWRERKSGTREPTQPSR